VFVKMIAGSLFNYLLNLNNKNDLTAMLVRNKNSNIVLLIFKKITRVGQKLISRRLF